MALTRAQTEARIARLLPLIRIGLIDIEEARETRARLQRHLARLDLVGG